MKIRILRAADVRRLLPMAECIERVRAAMIAASEGRVVLPLRTILKMPGDRGLFGVMPGYLAQPECFGVKLVSIIPRNKPPQHSSHLGLVLLFEPEHGEPVAMLDAAEITAIRTAAASGLATRLLSAPEAGDLAILGAGEQAHTHLEAMLAVRPVRRVRLWARDAAKAAAFAAETGVRHGIRVEVCDTVRAAVDAADLICTVTKASDPILEGGWLSPGAHLNVVGSSIRSAAEVDTATVVRSRFFVDRRESTVNEGGEYWRALEAGAITKDHIAAEIGEVANGSRPGRTSGEEITLYKSLGIAAQDLVSAQYVYERALEQDVGQAVDF